MRTFTTVDERRVSILVIDGKHVPALRVHLDGQTYCQEARPDPHRAMNVMCRNATINHDGHWYVVFTNTVEWDDQHMLSFDTERKADAFWRAYRMVQREEYEKADGKIVLYRIGGILVSDPYTPNKQTWNLYSSREDDEPYHPECEVCDRRVGTLYYLSNSGREVCVSDVEIRGEA